MLWQKSPETRLHAAIRQRQLKVPSESRFVYLLCLSQQRKRKNNPGTVEHHRATDNCITTPNDKQFPLPRFILYQKAEDKTKYTSSFIPVQYSASVATRIPLAYKSGQSSMIHKRRAQLCTGICCFLFSPTIFLTQCRMASLVLYLTIYKYCHKKYSNILHNI